MNRGRRSENIYSNEKDFEIFLSLLQEAVELWNIRVSAYCLMSNHYHILLQTPQGNLNRFMRHLNGVYTQRYNRLHGYDGQLFRGRYKAILVAEDSYLLELVRYIHRNPLRAGLVASLNNYPWSSHHGYLSTAKTWNWLHKDFILSMLTGKRNPKKAYLQFMAIEDSQEVQGVFAKKRWPSMLGSEDFINWVKETFFALKKHQQVPESLQLAPKRELIIREVRKNYGVSEEELFTAQRGKLNEPRNTAIYLCRQIRNDTLMDLGEAFGMTGYSPAGSAIDRVKKKLLTDKRLQKRLKKITAAISRFNK